MNGRHAVWIQVVPSVKHAGLLTYQARCSKGWEAPARFAERIAREDGASHLGTSEPFVRAVNNLPVRARQVF